MKAHRFIYLASQSPRRRQLLEQIGVVHELLLPDAHEDAESLEVAEAGETPERYVQRVTELKLHAAMERLRRRGLPAAPVLCADTTVVLGKRILGKPADADEAQRMLQALSGRTHRVLTAVAVGLQDAGPGGSVPSGEALPQTVSFKALSTSRVRFAPLSAMAIKAYIASGEPMGKAGAYGIQGAAAQWISHIEGSHSGIMGLPLHETDLLLRQVHARD